MFDTTPASPSRTTLAAGRGGTQARRTAPTTARAAVGWRRAGPTRAKRPRACAGGDFCVLCPQTRRTVSLLPDGLAAHLPGTLADVERVVRTVQRAGSVEQAADQSRTDTVTLPTALRWVRPLVQRVRAFLATCITLYPDRFGQLEPTLDAFGAILGSDAVLEPLRAVAADRLASLPAPVGFLWRNCALPAKPSCRQHANGLDPPPPAA